MKTGMRSKLIHPNRKNMFLLSLYIIFLHSRFAETEMSEKGMIE